MILIDREDVDRLGLWTYPFLVKWEIGSPEAVEADYADTPAEGPFLLVVTDEDARAGQTPDTLSYVARKRADPINLRWWTALADLYAGSMGISRQSLVLRFSSIRRRVKRQSGQWLPFEEVYHWPEGEDLTWSALVHGRHPWIEAREHDGQRQVRYIQ